MLFRSNDVLGGNEAAPGFGHGGFVGQVCESAVDHDPDFLQARSEGVGGLGVLRDDDAAAGGAVGVGERIGGLGRQEADGG